MKCTPSSEPNIHGQVTAGPTYVGYVVSRIPRTLPITEAELDGRGKLPDRRVEYTIPNCSIRLESHKHIVLIGRYIQF